MSDRPPDEATERILIVQDRYTGTYWIVEDDGTRRAPRAPKARPTTVPPIETPKRRHIDLGDAS